VVFLLLSFKSYVTLSYCVSYCVQVDRTALKYMTLASDLVKRYWYKYVTVGIPSRPIHNRIIVAAEFIPMWHKV